MPRGKFLNHKGKMREFTPVEELRREQEQEQELEGKVQTNCDNLNSKKRIVGKFENANGNTNNAITNFKAKKLGNAVEGLIEISNPNRNLKKKTVTAMDQIGDSPPCEEKRRVERTTNNKDRQRASMNQKTPSEIKADIERLNLVRKKREAAAELRLAAKNEHNSLGKNLAIVAPNMPSKSDISFIKKSQKSPNDDNFEGVSDVKKLLKTRNGNKRNGLLNV